MKLTEKAMRTAVTERDPAMSGRFIYGVITTGIYCRPACRSRTPRPENLRFFANPGAAETAGFRACKRCRPLQTLDVMEPRVLSAARILLAEPHAALSLDALAKRVYWSPAHLQRRFKAALGVSPRQFQEAQRLGKLRGLLRSKGEIGRALLDAGFTSLSHAYRAAQRSLGMTPAQFRHGAPGERIQYLTHRSSLGWLLIAATTKGICFAQFGASPALLRSLLAHDFPRAILADAEVAAATAQPLKAWMSELLVAIDNGRTLTQIPVDLRGTAFQVRVWQALRKIAPGQTLSYRTLADRIRQPRAARAVASACAGNRIAVLIPCHRVIRSSGELAGYRWGIDRKRKLLDREVAKVTTQK